eukprot:8495107-Heterocapsa_arctica.AAC.1
MHHGPLQRCFDELLDGVGLRLREFLLEVAGVEGDEQALDVREGQVVHRRGGLRLEVLADRRCEASRGLDELLENDVDLVAGGLVDNSPSAQCSRSNRQHFGDVRVVLGLTEPG